MPEEDAPIRRTPYEWGRLILTNIVVVGIPTLVYYLLRVRGYDLFWLHITIAAVFMLTALELIWEALVTVARRRAAADPDARGVFHWVARMMGFGGGRLRLADLPPVPPR